MTKANVINLFLTHISKALKLKRKPRKTGYVRTFRRASGWRAKQIKEVRVAVQVISAVNAEEFSAFITADSSRKLHHQLSAPAARAILEKSSFLKTSSFYYMQEADWLKYPLLIVLGKSKYPFVVQHGNLMHKGTRHGIGAFLESIDNMGYLEAVTLKRKLVKELKDAAAVKPPQRKRSRRRSR